MVTLSYLLLPFFVNGIIAFELEAIISPNLKKRSLPSRGGWGVNEANCPVGSSRCFIGGCCPNELTCNPTYDPVNVICCPGTSSCIEALKQNPVCADSSWTLWNATTQGQYGGFFCCLDGQVGDNLGSCNSESTVLNATSMAISVAAGTQTATPTTDTGGLTTFASGSDPSLVLESISTGPPTARPTHSPIPSYTGSGSLLQGYCATPEYILLDGPTAYWAPAVGCVDDKTDCCPYSVAQTSATATATIVTVVSTVIANIGPGGTTQAAYSGMLAFPVPASTYQATLAHCPADYQTVSGGCCPSGYELWNSPLGGQVPCYSSLNSYLVPPAVPVTSQIVMSIPLTTGNVTTTNTPAFTSATTLKPTLAILNVVFALQYPVQSAETSLSTGAKAGIGAGAGVAAIAIVSLFILVWRMRKYKKNKAFTAVEAAGADSTGHGQSDMSSISPYTYSARTELPTDNVNHSLPTASNFVAREQRGHFPQQQVQ